MTSQFEVLASDPCPPGPNCPKIVRRKPGKLTVVGASVTDSGELTALGVGGGEGAVDIDEELIREAHANLITGES